MHSVQRYKCTFKSKPIDSALKLHTEIVDENFISGMYLTIEALNNHKMDQENMNSILHQIWTKCHNYGANNQQVLFEYKISTSIWCSLYYSRGDSKIWNLQRLNRNSTTIFICLKRRSFVSFSKFIKKRKIFENLNLGTM